MDNHKAKLGGVVCSPEKSLAFLQPQQDQIQLPSSRRGLVGYIMSHLEEEAKSR